MATNVKVAGVKKVDTGQYKYYEFSYEQDGEIRTKKVFNKDVAEQLTTLEVGDEVAVTWKKNDKGFYEVAGLTKGAANSNTKKTYAKTSASSSVRDSRTANTWEDKQAMEEKKAIGSQVGNALTNAVNSLGGAKVTIKQIETRAWELILLGERLKGRIANGDHTKENAEPDRDVTQEMDGYEEEDIPF